MLELLQEVGCDLQGQARFATASRASEGEQPGSREQPFDLGHLPFAANKPVHLERQIVRRGVEVLRHQRIFHAQRDRSSMRTEESEIALVILYPFLNERDTFDQVQRMSGVLRS